MDTPAVLVIFALAFVTLVKCSLYSEPAQIYGPPHTGGIISVQKGNTLKTQRAILPPHNGHHVELPPGSRADYRDMLGQFSHGFSDIDGTTLSEQGRLITTNNGWEAVIIKQGSYSYTSPEGKHISVSYIADENGFRVVGDHLP